MWSIFYIFFISNFEINLILMDKIKILLNLCFIVFDMYIVWKCFIVYNYMCWYIIIVWVIVFFFFWLSCMGVCDCNLFGLDDMIKYL